MIGDKQKQSVTDGSLAVQAAGDATVNVGITTDDMRAIVESMAEQLPKYAAVAAAVVEERLKAFEDKIVERFESELRDNRTAFEDPDFQYLLVSAQQTYARSGDDQTCDNLVNLIAERSKHKGRSLVSLSLNSAVERAGVLSRQEFAALSYAFFMRKVRRMGVASVEQLAAFLGGFLNPLLPDMPRTDTSYSYLESIGCGKISMGSTDMPNILVRTYPNLFCELSVDRLTNDTGDADFVQMLVDAGFLVPQPNGSLRLAPLSVDDFLEGVKNAGFDQAKGEATWGSIESQALPPDKISNFLAENGFDAQSHFQLWNDTALKHFEVTAVGTAIAYANLREIGDFPADLSIWLK